jgi:ferric-dicitrate binding protein FerR (iron transport regulator)
MKANQQIEDQAWELIAKSIYDENPDSAEEVYSSVTSEVFSDEKGKKHLTQVVQKVDLYFEQQKYSVDRAWDKVESRIHQQDSGRHFNLKKLVMNPFSRIAAAVIFGVLLLISGYEVWYTPSAKVDLLEISSNDQVINTFSLPDGTLVSLNSNTKIKYPKKFGRATREVSIEGEAFFEVTPNKNKPFIIHAGKAQIKVLGTSFNVSAYPEAKQVEVIVETGKVQVLNKIDEVKQSNELILVPGDKGTLVYSSNLLRKTTNHNPNFLAWKTHSLIFKATSLGEVIGNLEKVYKVDIQLADPGLNRLRLTAQFNNYSLDFILKVIETTFQIDVQKVDGQYILKARS